MEEKTCADCGMPLSPDETWVCDDCAAFYEMTDPNHKMTGEHNGETSQAKMQKP